MREREAGTAAVLLGVHPIGVGRILRCHLIGEEHRVEQWGVLAVLVAVLLEARVAWQAIRSKAVFSQFFSRGLHLSSAV